MQIGSTMKKTIIALFAGFISVSTYAIECKQIGHSDGKTHQFDAMINAYTHIELPENVMKGTKPLVGNKDLWTSDHAGPHLYIKPTSNLKPGATTSLSAVGESGKSYDFKIRRKDNLDNTCFKLTDGVLFTEDQRHALTKRTDNTPMELANLWKDKYMQQRREASEEAQEAVLEALRRYRYQIYTRYDWKKSKSRPGHGKRGTKGFIGTDLVADVYDDGRFTYIRVYTQNRGIMMVEATLEGQTEIIEAKYDTLNKMYTISGIFPEFTLKYGESKVKITRADNSTVGEY